MQWFLNFDRIFWDYILLLANFLFDSHFKMSPDINFYALHNFTQTLSCTFQICAKRLRAPNVEGINTSLSLGFMPLALVMRNCWGHKFWFWGHGTGPNDVSFDLRSWVADLTTPTRPWVVGHRQSLKDRRHARSARVVKYWPM